jgi:hypothetical protein
MTVAAIDAIVTRMMLMAELDGLLTNDVLAREIRGVGKTKHGHQP